MASQHFDFTTQQGFPQTPSDALTIVRNSEVLPENEGGATVVKILANKLMMTTVGLHVWEQRINLLPDSFNFTAWSARGTPIAQDRNQLAPDGTFTASTITVGAAGVLDFFKALTGLSTSTNHEVSFFIKRSSETGILLAQKTSSGLGQTGQWNIDMSLLPDNYIRLTENNPAVTVIQNFRSSTAGGLGLFFVSADGIERTFNIWGVQLEEGATVSPYVSTNGATVTRPEDKITQAVSQMGFGANEGMIVIDLITPSGVVGTTDRHIFSMSDGTINNELQFFRESGVYRLKLNVPGQSVSQPITGITDLTKHKIAIGWTTDGKLNVSVDGGTVQTFGTPAAVNFIPQANFILGADLNNAKQLNSTINSLTSYPDYSPEKLQLRSTARIRAIATNHYRRQGNG